MATQGKGRIFRWLLLVAAGIGIGYLIFSPSKESIDEARDKRHVAVEIQAGDETAAAVKIRKLAGGPSKLTVAIPAGTIISNSDSGGQGLITARAVTIQLSDASPQTTQQVETYCLRQFAAPPTLESHLYLPSGAYTSSNTTVDVEEIEPLQKLVSCLAKRSDSRADRELAVWLIADKRSQESYEDVKSELRESFLRQGESGLTAEMMTDIREKLKSQFPGIGDERLNEEISYYQQNTLDKRISQQAGQKAAEEVRDFLRVGRPLLEECGQKTSEMKFFRTAPQTP